MGQQREASPHRGYGASAIAPCGEVELRLLGAASGAAIESGAEAAGEVGRGQGFQNVAAGGSAAEVFSQEQQGRD